MIRRFAYTAFSFLFLALHPSLAHPQPLQILDQVDGWDQVRVASVSADGQVLVGFVRNTRDTNQSRAFRWEDGTLTLLNALPGHADSRALDVSEDGSVIVGSSCETWLTTDCRGVRWTGTSPVPLPVADPDADGGHHAYVISSNGSVIAGHAVGPPYGLVRWIDGAAPVSAAGAQLWGWPHAISFDGNIIAGSETVPQRGELYGYEDDTLFRIDGQNVTPLPLPAGHTRGSVLAMSGDGSVIVGAYRTAGQNNRPLRWSTAGVEELPLPDDALTGSATAASYDGSVIVGSYYDQSFDEYLVIWRDGVVSRVAEELQARGVDLSDIRLRTPYSLSADGTVIVGRGGYIGASTAYRVDLGGLVVNRLGDESDAAPGDGYCDIDLSIDGAQCTLRAALEEANAAEGADLVTFRLDGDAPFVIIPSSPLPPITDPLVLDGASQPGAGDAPLVRIDGSDAGSGVDGLVVNADDVTIRGFMITGFGGHGIHVAGGANGVLEGMIVGSDAVGTSGLGNDGDGIHVSGGTGLRIGSDAEATENAASIDLGVTLVSNGRHGLFAGDQSNASRIRAGKKKGAVAPAASFALDVQRLVVGVLIATSDAVPLPNGLDGIHLLGVQDASFDRVTISDAVENAFTIAASQAVIIRRALMGIRRPVAESPQHVGVIGGSAFRLLQSIGITIGSDDADDSPIQGGGAEDWFIEIEDSEDLLVRNVLAGITDNIDVVGAGVREALRNKAGGISLLNAPSVQVGAVGVPTILANNGGDETKPQAGLFAAGPATRLLRIVNVHLGTTPEGESGLGNLGDGLVLSDGAHEAMLGGLAEAERVVSAGNGRYGFLFKNLQPPTAGPPEEGLGSVVEASRLVSDFVKTVSGQLRPVPNGDSGVRLEQVQDVRLNALSLGPSARHAIEIIESIRVELESGSVGSYWGDLVESLDDVAGPREDGVVIVGGADISVGRRLREQMILSGYNVFVTGAGGRALHAYKTSRLQLANWAAGVSLEGSDETDALFEALGNELEASVLDECEDVDVENAAFMSNGPDSESGTGGLLVNLSRNIRIVSSQFGELTPEGQPRRPNYFSALKAVDTEHLQLVMSRVIGHEVGIIAESSSLTLEGNEITMQGTLGGIGDAVRASGGSIIRAMRNTLTENDGTGFWFTDEATGILRHNNMVDNGQGAVIDGEGDIARKTRAMSGVRAPDNWWGHASGPGGAGPGTGDAVSVGIEAASWLSDPVGVVITPASRVVEAWAPADTAVTVHFASPLMGDDVLDVSVSDERGWVTSPQSLQLETVAGGGATTTLELAISAGGADRITIEASSQTDPSLKGEATIVVARSGTVTPLAGDAEPGATLLDAEPENFVVGGEITINPGGANEETIAINSLGPVRLETPLRFHHTAGEPIAPANQYAVSTEDEPGTLEPAAAHLGIYPNPASRAASLVLDLPDPGSVSIALFDVVGRRLRLLQEGSLPFGRHEWQVELAGIPSGVYLVRARTADIVVSRTLVVAR